MALTVETGLIVAGANAYVSIASCDTYHSDRGNTAWASATTAAKTAAIFAATVYIDGKYRNRWLGERVQPLTQVLEWPRQLVPVPGANYYPSYQVPTEIVNATCELALRALTAPLAADIAPGDRLKRKKIDVLEWEYDIGNFQTSYPVVEQLISRFLRSGNDAVRG